MRDPYQYFRIEARELTDELTAALSGLVRGGPTAELVGGVLRHAHTLKGAARVVALAAIADHAHALEELIGPFRGASDPIPEPDLDRMQALVDDISSLLTTLPASTTLPAPTISPATAPTISPATAPTISPATAPSPERTLPNLRDHADLQTPTPRFAPEPQQADNAREAGAAAAQQQTARASLAEIDSVIHGVGQALTQLALLRECAARVARFRDRIDVVGTIKDTADEIQRVVAGCADRMDRELRQVHDVAERLRLVPVESIVPDLERGARDVAAAQGKRVRVDVSGGRIRLDAPVLATAQAALRQMVRNAVAHGIEDPAERIAAGKDAAGHVQVDVVQSAGQVVFSCGDDGRGIDLPGVRRELERTGRAGAGTALSDQEVLDLLMHGGLSTAATVSEISGHGIGLDVVQDAVRQLRGRVSIVTRAGVGTTITLTTPLSLTAQDVVLVDAGLVNAGPVNAGLVDAGLVNAGLVDAGLVNAGLVNAGLVNSPPDNLATIGGEPADAMASSRAVNTWLADPGPRVPGPIAAVPVQASGSRPARVVALPLSAVRETVRVGADEIERRSNGESLTHRGRAVPFLPLAAVLGDDACTSRSSPAWSVLLLSDGSGAVGIGVRRLIGTSGVAIRALPDSAPVSELVSGLWIDVDGRPALVLDPGALIRAARGRRQVAVSGASTRAPILIVDDSLTTRMLEQSILEAAGFQVELASSAEEGLLLAASRPFCLVLVDVEMPGMNGFEFVEQTRARPELRHLPCILVTTRASAQDRSRGLKAGARGHIDKGEFYQGTLLDRINELLAG